MIAESYGKIHSESAVQLNASNYSGSLAGFKKVPLE
jgi:hypothetical protein